MKLDVDPFPVDLINFEEKRVLMHTNQADTTRGKRVVVIDELKRRMMKPKNPKVGVWKHNVQGETRHKWRPTSDFLMDKYMRE
jgi:hypothetical protein